MIPIPGIGYAKLIGLVVVVATLFGAYRFAVNFWEQYKEDQRLLVQVQIESSEKTARIQYMENLSEIKDQFQDDKIALQQELIQTRQSNLDDQERRITNMGSADHMAVVAEAENDFSKGSERLTFRAQRATEIITERIEKKTRHETLYAE